MDELILLLEERGKVLQAEGGAILAQAKLTGMKINACLRGADVYELDPDHELVVARQGNGFQYRLITRRDVIALSEVMALWELER